MKRIPVDSSMIASVGYDRQEKTLEVEFVNTGHVYEYYDVPYQQYLNLMKADSKGSYMKDCIIDCYDYGRVSRGRRKLRQPPALPTIDLFVGVYSIYEMVDFDEEYVHAEGPASLQIDPDGRGEFQFGYVQGQIHGKVTHRHGETMYRFRWEGNDENDEASGDGWLVLETEDEAEGEISFFDGDDYFFRARKKE